jgi:translation initiation factor IF-2
VYRFYVREDSFMEEEKVGLIIKFFAKPGVAAIELTDGSLSLGDKIRIKGHTTDFQQEVVSMQIENSSVDHAEVGSSIGIKVSDRVRSHDVVYRVKE